VPTYLAVVWFEKFGSDSKRTILNRFFFFNRSP
jgi:hypothetical protein